MCCGDDPDTPPHDIHCESHDTASLYGDPAVHEVASAHGNRLDKGSTAPAGERDEDSPRQFDGTRPSSRHDPVIHQLICCAGWLLPDCQRLTLAEVEVEEGTGHQPQLA